MKNQLVSEQVQKALKTKCDLCGGDIGDEGVYEFEDGEYGCIDCYTTAIDHCDMRGK